MEQTYWTNEKACVNYARQMFIKNHKTQLIFKKGRKYYCVQGELKQKSLETFKNAFGETCHYSEHSDVRRQYETNEYEFRGWVNSTGCFKNN